MHKLSLSIEMYGKGLAVHIRALEGWSLVGNIYPSASRKGKKAQDPVPGSRRSRFGLVDCDAVGASACGRQGSKQRGIEPSRGAQAGERHVRGERAPLPFAETDAALFGPARQRVLETGREGGAGGGPVVDPSGDYARARRAGQGDQPRGAEDERAAGIRGESGCLAYQRDRSGVDLAEEGYGQVEVFDRHPAEVRARRLERRRSGQERGLEIVWERKGDENAHGAVSSPRSV